MNKELYKRLMFFMPIAALWLFLSQPWKSDQSTPLSELKQMAMNWRYRIRGPIEATSPHNKAPLPLVYVNMDATTVSQLGERPWNRKVYADVARALVQIGGAKVIAYDFILSPLTATDMVPSENIRRSNQALADVIAEIGHRIVLACSYTGVKAAPYMSEHSILPLIYMGTEHSAALPEMPTFPIIDTDKGITGLITVDESMGYGAIPTWIPIFSHYKGDAYGRNLMLGKQFHFKSLKLALQSEQDRLELINENNISLFEMPLDSEKTFWALSLQIYRILNNLPEDALQIHNDNIMIHHTSGITQEIPLHAHQLLEVNWFSSWDQSEHNIHVSMQHVIDLWTIFNLSQDMEPWHEYWKLSSEEQREYSIDTIIDYAANEPEWASNRLDPKHEHILAIHKLNEKSAQQAAAYAYNELRKFKDTVALIGPTDKTLQDLAPTPFDASTTPKVAVHGNLLKTIYSEKFIKRIEWHWHLLALLAASVFGFLAALYEGTLHRLIRTFSGLLMAAYVIAVFAVFNTMHIVLPLVAPLGAFLSIGTLGFIWRVRLEEKQKSRIQGMFGTYLSPGLVSDMVQSGDEPQLGGEDTEVSAFFSDVASFSSFSEKLSPKQLVKLMNDYLTEMTDILMEEGCFVDKYIGDAIVGIFNAPISDHDHAYKACKAACRIQDKQLELCKKWQAEGDWPDRVFNMKTRIGINTGHATVGNMGSYRRFNYTMMGDTVNLAARCESGAKSYGVYIMVSESTRDQAMKTSDDCLFRKLDKIIVKGRSAPVCVYELVCMKDDASPELLQLIDTYENAFAAYLKMDWSAATRGFENALNLESHRPVPSTQSPSMLMLERCKHLAQKPPSKDWDGVFVMQTK